MSNRSTEIDISISKSHEIIHDVVELHNSSSVCISALGLQNMQIHTTLKSHLIRNNLAAMQHVFWSFGEIMNLYYHSVALKRRKNAGNLSVTLDIRRNVEL